MASPGAEEGGGADAALCCGAAPCCVHSATTKDFSVASEPMRGRLYDDYATTVRLCVLLRYLRGAHVPPSPAPPAPWPSLGPISCACTAPCP